MSAKHMKILSLIFATILLVIPVVACNVDFNSAPLETDPPVTRPRTTTAAVTTTAAETTTKKETTTAETTTEPPQVPSSTIPVDTTSYDAQTGRPKVIARVNTAPDEIVIAGSCEKNSTIIVRGGEHDVAFKSSDIYFMGTVPLYAWGETELKIYAQAEGKAESDPFTLVAAYDKYATGLRDDRFEVVMGLDSQGHFVSALEDWLGENLISDKQLEFITKETKSRVEWLKENTGGELIYLIVPDSMTLYPETVPSKYKEASVKRSQQFVDALKAGGATVIDPLPALQQHKSDPLKLFHKTDSHWTEYGAFVAYTELFNYISKTFPEAAPRDFSEFGFHTSDCDGGDMPYYLEFDTAVVREVAVFADYQFIEATPKFAGENQLLMNHNTTPKAKLFENNNDKLPNLVVYRDSYGIAMYDMVRDRCNICDYIGMWDYGFDKNEIKKYDADYVLVILAERDIGDAMDYFG